jgi:hypothetical protein
MKKFPSKISGTRCFASRGRPTQAFGIFASILASFLLAACATVAYDDQADQQLTALSQELNLQFITWESQLEAQTPTAVPYDAAFYNKVEADITTLEIRMEASQSEATDKLVPVFQSLAQQVENLRNLHQKQGQFKDAAFLHAEQNLLNVQIASLLTFELSLKPSQVGGSSTAKTSSTAVATTKTAEAATHAALPANQ